MEILIAASGVYSGEIMERLDEVGYGPAARNAIYLARSIPDALQLLRQMSDPLLVACHDPPHDTGLYLLRALRMNGGLPKTVVVTPLPEEVAAEFGTLPIMSDTIDPPALRSAIDALYQPAAEDGGF